MGHLWLPLKDEITGRKDITLIPEAGSIDASQLQEIIQWSQEKYAAECKALGPRPQPRYSRAEIGKMIREFQLYQRAKQRDLGHKLVY